MGLQTRLVRLTLATLFWRTSELFRFLIETYEKLLLEKEEGKIQAFYFRDRASKNRFIAACGSPLA